MNKPNLASAQLQEPGTQTSIACRTDPHGLLEG
jgi:hypothetical protein